MLQQVLGVNNINALVLEVDDQRILHSFEIGDFPQILGRQDLSLKLTAPLVDLKWVVICLLVHKNRVAIVKVNLGAGLHEKEPQNPHV